MSQARSSVTVELDIFSGRPNPSWILGSNEGAELLQLVRSKSVVATSSSPPPALGYRGFVVTIASGARPERLRVWAGTVELDGRHYDDADRTVERYLIRTMPNALQSQFRSLLP